MQLFVFHPENLMSQHMVMSRIANELFELNILNLELNYADEKQQNK